MKTLTLIRPDDWHCHLRDGPYLTRTVTDTSQRFQRAIVMPNLLPIVSTVDEAKAYRQRILHALPMGHSFEPLMTLYLTENTTPEEIIRAKTSGFVLACKLYPAGATTNAHAGITDLRKSYALFEIMQQQDVPLLIHAEVVDPSIDILNTESAFIEKELTPLLKNFPSLRIVIEHISSKRAVDFIQAAKHPIAATITPHHLRLTLNDLLGKGIQPHYYCRPIVKQRADREALVQAAISGHPKFFLGTDSAPHTQASKECSTGCAGIYSAHAAIEIYAELFETHGALHRLSDFAGRWGALFYKLPIHQNTLTLIRKPWTVPETLSFGTEKLVPFLAGQTLHWQIHHDH